MPRCPSCSSPAPESARFCPSCAAELGSLSEMATDLATPSAVAAARRRSPSSSSGVGRLASSDSIDTGGFTPGTVLAERYRIIGLLGRGGMGEVYRADDLKLGQPVALKFLPSGLAHDPVRLEQFYSEVRLARQVSHPNVCRVYDVGELDGQQYLSMEYVDGEDLASLLKRIGRLPQDKAVEVSRQLCAGLAAAHERGVLHRDLKPANVMLDGRGRARITDFGLAVAAGDAAGGEISGTPTYMAPEQLEGKPATVRSDIHALGLVLYELYTGRKAYEASSLPDLKQKKQEPPRALSEISRDVDPVVERVILRCVEPDPASRPASALQVAAALPGGDPLAAALAAGETPSPEMVAASGKAEGLKPAVAWSCLAAVVFGVAVCVFLNPRTQAFGNVGLEKPPEVLSERAREILTKLGHTASATDSAFGFTYDGDYFRYVKDRDKSPTRWKNLEGNAMQFWYRQSPRELEPLRFFTPSLTGGTVTPNDPPPDLSGMATVWLSPRGRLMGLLAVPPQVEATTGPSPAPAWDRLFSEAGLDAARWTATEPQWTPRIYADTRAAWQGAFPEQPKTPIRIEAAAYRGKPVYFEVIGPWTRPTRMKPYEPTAAERVSQVIGLLILGALLVGGVLFARRNLRLGRGDRRGAFRLALFVFALLAAAWLFGASHVASFYEVGIFIIFLSWALFITALLWVIYIALEPLVRRRWPRTIVSWSRLLAGEVKDPLVGRDVLVGFVAATAVGLLDRLEMIVPGWLGLPPAEPQHFQMLSLLGARVVISELLGTAVGAVFFGLALLFILFLLRLLLRREWAAAVVFVLIFLPGRVLQSETPLVTALCSVISMGILVLLLMHFGLLAAIAAGFLSNLMTEFPVTPETSAWYAGVGFTALAILAVLLLYAFRTSLGGRPLFGPAQLED